MKMVTPVLDKRCMKCEGLGPFHKDRTKKDGLRNVCRSCIHAYSVAYNASHVEINRAQCKAWRAAHPDEVRVKNHKWYEGPKSVNKWLTRGAIYIC